MTDPTVKVRSALLVVIVLVGTVPAAGAGTAAAAATGNAPEAFHLEQAGQCYEVGALGDGSTSVEEFYDYRSADTDPSSEKYASFGTTDLQDNQESKLFVYDGSDGYSLVVLHDKFARYGGNGSNASTVTFELTGVGDGTWTVQDDYYGGEQDDNWDTAGNTHEIDWMWSDNRTDGGALTGVADETITIDPAFNEDASEWGSWDWSGDGRNTTEGWYAVDADGEYRLEASLDMSESVTLAAGTCGDAAGPDAALTASPNPANDAPVTLDAGESTDPDGDIDAYHWDVDGDGEIEERTDDATLEHTYGQPGEYDASVVVVDEAHKQDAATTTVEVTESDGGDGGDGGDGDDGQPTAKLSLERATVDLYDTVGFNASASTDDGDIVEYRWDLDGDGEVERTTPDNATEGNPDNYAHTVHHPAHSVYDANGTYHPEVTVVDDEGNTDTASATITVERHDYTAPNATLDVPEEVTVGEEFTVEATDFTEAESRLAFVNWVFGDEDDDETPTGAVATHAFAEIGEKKVEFQVSDHAGNKNVMTRWVDVTTADSDDGDGGGGGPPSGGGDDDGNEGGFEDPDDDDTRSGGLPGADPGGEDDSDERALDDEPRNVSANVTDGDGRLGTVVVTADDGPGPTVEVYETAPGGLPAPSPDADGFEAVAFLTVDGADRVNVTLAADRLAALDAAPEDVSLFSYANGTWTAVDTAVANATGDAYRFRAEASNGTYAVGVERASIGVPMMNVRDETVGAGESADVAATVENTGLANGTAEVDLVVDGEVVATRTVSLSAGEWTTVRFDPTFADAGTYEVTVGGETEEVVVEAVETTTTTTEPSDPSDATTTTTEATTTDDETTGGVPGFGVGVALVALLASALLALRRR